MSIKYILGDEKSIGKSDKKWKKKSKFKGKMNNFIFYIYYRRNKRDAFELKT